MTLPSLLCPESARHNICDGGYLPNNTVKLIYSFVYTQLTIAVAVFQNNDPI